MKKFSLIFLFLTLCFSAQTHRFIYEIHYKKDSAENLISKQNYYLDINPDESFYYARPFFISDSILLKTGDMTFGGKMNDYIRVKSNSKDYEVFAFEGFDTFKIVENATQKWKISPETKMLANLKVQKAITNWGGRNWEGWFAPEIPFQEGPYKFNGLPGLIVEISDDKNNYQFTLVKSENIKETQILDFYKRFKGRAVEIPVLKYAKMKLETYFTPVKPAHDGTIDITKSNFMTEDNLRISSMEELKVYEDAFRKSLKKYNNPIELNKAVHYPND
ncbi:MAG: GLPGLI family protein [Chryseobacterium sp.]|nr:GLPGLI family protein [Chryseobacterium sp.]